MTKSNHDMGFRPSHFPALEQCIHHTRKEGPDSEACKRGIILHEAISEYLGNPEGEILMPFLQFAIGLVDKYCADGWSVYAVEKPVLIVDENGEQITLGTIDLVLSRAGDFLIIDWKTGDKSDYTAQLAAYIMGFWDTIWGSVTGLIGYVDLEETETVDLSYSLCSKRVLDLYEKWKDKEKQPYVINSYCDYCSLRGSCPAWARAATQAFDKINYLAFVNPKTGLPQGGDLVPAAITNLKNDPGRLEEFLLAWDRAKTLVEEDWELKAALKMHMETGFKAEHHILVHVKDKITKSIDPEQFLQRVALKIGTMKAAPAIKVDPEKALEAWTNFTADPFPVKIDETVTPRPPYVRVKGKKGAGDARRKREALE